MTFIIQRHPKVSGAFRLKELEGDFVVRASPWKQAANTAKQLERMARAASLKNEEAEKVRAHLFGLFPLPAPDNRKAITFDTPHMVNFNTFLDQVKDQRYILIQMGKDPLQGFDKRCRNGKLLKSHTTWDDPCGCQAFGESQAEYVLNLEAERRFIEWQKATKKHKTWYEVLKTPHKGSNHEVYVVRKFRNYVKACEYAQKRNEQPDRPASYDVQVRHGVAPVKPKQLLGFDPNQVKEIEMAKAKAKVKAKNGANGADAKKSSVKKDKAYYLKCASGQVSDCGSGDFIRGCIIQGKKTAQEIADATRKKFKGHSTKPSDVYWNRGQLKAAGIAVPKMGGDK